MAAAAKDDRIRELEPAVAGMAAANQHMHERIRVLDLQTKVTEVYVVDGTILDSPRAFATYEQAREEIERLIEQCDERYGNVEHLAVRLASFRTEFKYLTPDLKEWDTGDSWGSDDNKATIEYSRLPVDVGAPAQESGK